MFRRDEKDALGLRQLFAKRQPVGRGCCLEVLVEERNAVQRGEGELERRRRERCRRAGGLWRKALLAQAADDGDDGMRGGHEISLWKRKQVASLKPHRQRRCKCINRAILETLRSRAAGQTPASRIRFTKVALAGDVRWPCSG